MGAVARPVVLHARRPGARSSTSIAQAWAGGEPRYAFAILDAARGDRLVGRIALANVVRGAWQNATLGYWVDVAASGGRGARDRGPRA